MTYVVDSIFWDDGRPHMLELPEYDQIKELRWYKVEPLESLN